MPTDREIEAVASRLYHQRKGETAKSFGELPYSDKRLFLHDAKEALETAEAVRSNKVEMIAGAEQRIADLICYCKKYEGKEEAELFKDIGRRYLMKYIIAVETNNCGKDTLPTPPEG